MNTKNETNLFEYWNGLFNNWNHLLKPATEFWEYCSGISKLQKNTAENYKNIFFGMETYKQFMQLAPTNLQQAINPWSFSLMSFTKEIKGTPTLEHKIITEVAGYGSQIGTILDFLEILAEQYPIDEKKLKEPEDICKFYNFRDLVEKINKVKEEV